MGAYAARCMVAHTSKKASYVNSTVECPKKDTLIGVIYIDSFSCVPNSMQPPNKKNSSGSMWYRITGIDKVAIELVVKNQNGH